MDDTIMQKQRAIDESQTLSDPRLVLDLQVVQHSIFEAQNTADLKEAAQEIQALVHRVIAQVPAAERLTRIISKLNDALTQRIIEIRTAGTPLNGLRWCWISLGSEGREEQTLSSDQDNGIVFEDGPDPDRTRELLLPMAMRINETLDACGFPFCRGQVMASNPQWCLNLYEWRERFTDWIMEGDPVALLNASIFFDLRPLYGERALANELAVWLTREASQNSRFLFQMSGNALKRTPPLGMFRKFAVEKSGDNAGTLNMKVNGAAIFVDAGRIYGLVAGSLASNTADRLRHAAAAQRLHPVDVDEWIKAFYFIQMLRLKNQHLDLLNGTHWQNHVDPSRLDKADQNALVDALRKARSLQNRLALDYPGSK